MTGKERMNGANVTVYLGDACQCDGAIHHTMLYGRVSAGGSDMME